MSATSCPPSITVTYLSGYISEMIFFISCVQCCDLELALITAVFPPAMAAIKTPRDNMKGKLKGLMMRDTPYGTL